MKSKLVTRIWLSFLLVVLSWVGLIVGVMLSLSVLARCNPHPSEFFLEKMLMLIFACASSSTLLAFYLYLGPLILLGSSVIRCKSPARHAVVQTIACFGFGVFNILFFFMPCRGEGAAYFAVILFSPIFIGAAIAWIEAKKSLSLRKLSAAILAMFVVLYALVATISWIDGRFHKEPSTSTPQRTI
jgi:hypothetical protein